MDRAEFFKRQIAAHRGKFGVDSSRNLEEFSSTHVGLEMPPLALQYLLTSEVLLLSRILAISGAPGCNKSALGYELCRLFIDGGGVTSVIETENKASTSLMKSIMSPVANYEPFYDVKSAKTIELAQDYVTAIVDDRQKQMAAASKGKGKKGVHGIDDELPQMVLVDSIVGTPSDETSDKIMAEGHADRGHPKEALVLARFFPTLSSKLEGLPLLFVFTNHEKLDLKSMVGAVRNPGGDALHFYSTYHIRVQKIGTLPSKAAQGNKLKFTTKKNSMGPDKRSIEISFSWWSEPAPELPEKVRQVSRFDWDRAWLDLLSGADIPRSTLGEVMTVTKNSADSYNCAALGVKDAPPEEVMKAMYAHPEELERAKRILGIYAWRRHGRG